MKKSNETPENEKVENIIDSYKELEEQCDKVLKKINKRKVKKIKK